MAATTALANEVGITVSPTELPFVLLLLGISVGAGFVAAALRGWHVTRSVVKAVGIRRDPEYLYGLATRGEVVAWYPTLQQATVALEDVLTDEPLWRGRMSVVVVDFLEQRAATVLL